MDTTWPQRKTAIKEYIVGKEIWRKKCGQQDTSTAGGRWRRQHKTELDGNKWSVDYVPLAMSMSVSKTFIGGAVCRKFESEAPVRIGGAVSVTMHKSSQLDD